MHMHMQGPPFLQEHDQFYHSMLVKVGVDFFRIRPYFFVIANQQLHSNVTISLPIDIYK